ncbi:hypothetical protein REPUB_Repub02eG0081200 [Reevesia pubescens]
MQSARSGKERCEALGKYEDMINKLGLFSSNEINDDIITTNLKYLLEFITFCEAMELVPQEEFDAYAQGAPNSFADRRPLKVGEVDVLDDDGEEEREAWLTTILLAICKVENMICLASFSYEDWGVDELIVEDSWKRQERCD